ncbi:MAG: hypothetical protein ABSD73_08185 [Candidatus Bathyarchaeia archaeon]|jgi:hypothetical protein
MSTPLIGRNAVVQYVSGGTATTIGYAQGVTEDLTADLIKEFQLNSDHAAILAAGNKHFKIAVDRMYIDAFFSQVMYGNQVVDFVIGPAGTSVGLPKITIKNVVLIAHNIKVDQKGIVGQKITGEGSDRIITTF